MSASKPLPSLALLRALLRHDPLEGTLYWRERDHSLYENNGITASAKALRFNRLYANKQVRVRATHDGYQRFKILGGDYFVHRIIWKMEYGTDPVVIDHQDGDKSNNSISNLRSVDHLKNSQNLGFSRRNTSGVFGVCWNAKCSKWQANIQIRRRKIHLGTFHDLDSAISARRAAERRYGFHENHGVRR